jgi:NAD(P)-dependent dehydrogenase (short-subunit alcohol dehydrogenase family)
MSERHVLITGGSRGIGRAATLLFLREGFRVSMISRSPLAGELPKRHPRFGWFQGDMLDLASFPCLIAEICGHFGTIDHVILNAGEVARFSLAEASVDAFDRLLAVNFKGPYFLLQRVIPVMNDGGSVVLVSSISASFGFADVSVYAASKAALSSLCRSLSPELLERSITINAAHLGAIATDLISVESRKQRERVIPLGRIGRCEEAAGLLLFLCQPSSRYMTGQAVHLDGGIGACHVER